MSYDRTERIRRAAILIASLDETVAEQMLDNMPRGEATKILAEVERLGELDADELEDVLDEFRTAGRRGRSADGGVEFTYSAPQPMVMAGAVQTPPAGSNSAAAEVDHAADGDAVLMAELLGREHPQTIAAVLSRLEQNQGAAVFAALPGELQVDVLDRLANLELADEGAVQEIETQLQQRMEEHRQRRGRAMAAAELARRMVQKTPAAQRETLMARLAPASMPKVTASVEAGTEDRLEQLRQGPDRVTTVRMTRHSPPGMDYDAVAPGRFEAWADDASANTIEPQQTEDFELEDRSRELELLDDRTLLETLRAADERTVYCALAASSEKFLNRVASRLPRRQARKLRETVRSIGPTRIAELREAQHQLVAIAQTFHQAALATR
jgi:flagellar motor switch protein FliG